MPIEKVLRIKKLSEPDETFDLNYWMTRCPQDRISAIETLRRIYHGDAGRLQRVISIIRQE
jgi:hypothetical protein